MSLIWVNPRQGLSMDGSLSLVRSKGKVICSSSPLFYVLAPFFSSLLSSISLSLLHIYTVHKAPIKPVYTHTW